MTKLEIIKYNSVAWTATRLTPQEMVKLQPELPGSLSSVSKGTLTRQKPTIFMMPVGFILHQNENIILSFLGPSTSPPSFLFMFSENYEMAIFHVITAY